MDEECFVHESSYVDRGAQIGRGTKIWHFSHIQSSARIGDYCTLGQNVFVGENVCIGNHVKIQNNVSLYDGVILEDFVFCGPSAVFTNVIDPRSKYPQKGSKPYQQTLIREGASIGANATIICGTTIGRHAFIGAGSVVTRSVRDYALMLGVPAKHHAWICECGATIPEPVSDPASSSTCTPKSTCTRCKRSYMLSDANSLIQA